MVGPLLSVRQASCGYGDHTVLTDVSFDIWTGDFIGIIGPNGSGKTTCARLLSGIIQPSSGSILYWGTPLASLSPAVRGREIAFLPSGIELFSPLTVAEVVGLARFAFTGIFGRTTARDRQAVQEALERTGMTPYAGRLFSELSDGERQRALLAQAIAQEPRLLLLDEPTSHLDIGHQMGVMDLLLELNAAGITVVVILHDLNLASEYCRRLLLLDGGRVAADGLPDEVLSFSTIERVYHTAVLVYPNPHTGRPHIFGIPARLRQNPPGGSTSGR